MIMRIMIIKNKACVSFKNIKKILIIIFLSLIGTNSFRDRMNLNDFFDKNTTLLINAIYKLDRNQANDFIKNGIDLNVHGHEGITPLFWLLINGNYNSIKLALELGADPNYKAIDGRHTVPSIAGSKNDDILSLLLEFGGNPDALDLDGYPAIFSSISIENWEQINILIKAGADLNNTNKSNENTPLYAALLNKFEISYKLIEIGASYRSASTSGGTIANRIDQKLSKNLLSPKFKAYGWAIKTKELLISKGVRFPPYSPKEVRERIKNGQSIN